MARKRVTEPQLKSWEEVDACLKVMGDAENQLNVITAEMNAAIAEAKKAAEEKAAQYREMIKQNEGKIKEFTTVRKGELKGKSRQLTFGTVGFRQSTKLFLPPDTGEVILRLRENGDEGLYQRKGDHQQGYSQILSGRGNPEDRRLSAEIGHFLV